MAEQGQDTSFHPVPRRTDIPYLHILEQIGAALGDSPPVYLVGGAVRDLLLVRPTHDMDFVTPGDALSMARKVANALGGSYYTMDQEHETGRVILSGPGSERTVLDFSRQRGELLEEDLQLRDFTINAMAVEIHDPYQLIDPLGGSIDLRRKQLRACSQASFSNDSLRVLRALRLAQALSLKIDPETLRWLRQAAPLLPRVSIERQRDEIFRVLDGKSPSSVLRLMDMVGVLEHVLPELLALKDVEQSAPHIHDVWDHTLNVLDQLGSVLEVLDPAYNPDRASNLALGLVVLRLGRFRTQLNDHLNRRFTPDRSGRQLLLLAALYHDIAKPHSWSVDSDGRIRFFDHDLQGAGIMARRSQALHLSNEETEHLKKTVQYHMRPMLLAQAGTPSRKAIYRFFRDAHQSGVDVCLLSVADYLGTVGSTLLPEDFQKRLDTIRILLEAWWEKPQESVAPPALIDGGDIMEHFHLPPGKLIGELLEAVRESQAAGLVQTRMQALDLVQTKLDEIN